MDPRDDDIQFDFFADEPATTEAQPSGPRLPRRGGRGTGLRRGGPPRSLTPVWRLLALVVVVVVLLVLFGLLLQSCGATSKHDQAKAYLDRVATIARSSQDDGAAAASALVTAGAKPPQLATKLHDIAAQEQQNVTSAEKLDPPGPFRQFNQQLVEALQLRVSGVQGLATTFARNPTSKGAGEADVLSAQADRLVASDVVWDDLYVAPVTAELKREGVSGVAPPPSRFVANRDLMTSRSMALLLARLRGTSTKTGTTTGIRGTNLVDVKVLPSGQVLSESSDNTVVGSTRTAFVVGVEDSGDSQEVGIKVTLTIERASGGGTTIVKNKTLALINPGQTKTVTFSSLGELPFGYKANVLVSIATVPGEHNVNNNKGSFPVFFSLG